MNTTPEKKQPEPKAIKLSEINYNSVMFKRKQMLDKIEQRDALNALNETRGCKK